MRRTLLTLASVGLTLAPAGCAPDGSVAEHIREPTDSAFRVEAVQGEPTLLLEGSPTDFAEEPPEDLITLEPDLDLRDDAALGMAADVVGLPEGGFAVLDGLDRQVVIFDASGHVLRELGGEGAGPREFGFQTWALERLEDGALVVWEGTRASPFTIFSRDGSSAGTVRAPGPGDWTRPFFRKPRLDLFFPQHGPEDVTRRLVAHPSGGFLHYLQQDDADPRRGPATRASTGEPTGYVLHYATAGTELVGVDTLAVLAGVPVRLVDTEVRIRATGRPLTVPFAVQPLGTARPLLAAGFDWFALAPRDSGRVRVRTAASRPAGPPDERVPLQAEDDDRALDDDLVIRWPRGARPMMEADRLQAARWNVAYSVATSSYAARLFTAATIRENGRGVRTVAGEQLAFADSVPALTAMMGRGDCLFLAGYSASDWPDGTALTWLVVDVVEPALEAALRFEPPETGMVLDRRGAVVRDITSSHAYGLYRDGQGASHVLRYPLPDLACLSDEA